MPQRRVKDHKTFVREEYIRDLAKQQHHHDGECEIDHNAVISEGDDNGAYVQAWVWVEFAGSQLDKETIGCDCGAFETGDPHRANCAKRNIYD
jgi:hypothetical protein